VTHQIQHTLLLLLLLLLQVLKGFKIPSATLAVQSKLTQQI
jgi:hypothetical protein